MTVVHPKQFKRPTRGLANRFRPLTPAHPGSLDSSQAKSSEGFCQFAKRSWSSVECCGVRWRRAHFEHRETSRLTCSYGMAPLNMSDAEDA
jgi:hypothetical protein